MFVTIAVGSTILKQDSQKVELPQERHLKTFLKTFFARDAAQGRRISLRRSKIGLSKIKTITSRT